MKKIFILLIGLVFINTNAQKMSANYLEGHWISEEGSKMKIKKNNKNNLVIEKTLADGDSLKVVKYYMDKKNLYIETLLEQNNYEAVGKYFIIDENTMVADIVSNYPGQVIYKRLINPKGE